MGSALHLEEKDEEEDADMEGIKAKDSQKEWALSEVLETERERRCISM